MIYRVKYSAHYTDLWKDFNTLFDAANYASEIRGTVFDKDNKPCPIKGLRIEFIEPEEKKEEENPAADANQ